VICKMRPHHEVAGCSRRGVGLTILLGSRRRSAMLLGESAFERFWTLWNDARCTSQSWAALPM